MAERDQRTAEKRQAALQAASQRLAERDQHRLAREVGRSREVDRKLGVSGLNGQMGPHPLPKK